MPGLVLERDQFQRRVEPVAGQHALHFQIGQQRFFQVVAIAGVVHVEHGVGALVRVGLDQCIQLPGGGGRPVLEFGGAGLADCGGERQRGEYSFGEGHGGFLWAVGRKLRPLSLPTGNDQRP